MSGRGVVRVGCAYAERRPQTLTAALVPCQLGPGSVANW